MSEQRLVAVAAGAGFTNIRATIACHYLRALENIDRTKALEYKRADDGFTATYTIKAGDSIELIGHGRSGILGRPPGYGGTSRSTGLLIPPNTAPAAGDSGGGDIVLKVRDAAGAAFNLIVTESENEL
jgi:hypothetical protein